MLQVTGQTKVSTGPKVQLAPGKGLMDWIRLTNSGKDLTGIGGKLLNVREQDMEKHSTRDNAWTIINGLVYNVTAYMDFHPGGVEQLMRAVGTDGTRLFNEIHPWVNYESMLKACLVGRFVGSTSALKAPGPPPLESTAEEAGIRIVGCKKEKDKEKAELQLETRWEDSSLCRTFIEASDPQTIRILFRPLLEPSRTVEWKLPSSRIKTGSLTAKWGPGGRVTIRFSVEDGRSVWNVNNTHLVKVDSNRRFRVCRVEKISEVNHDTRLIRLSLPSDCLLTVPIGHHVCLRIPASDLLIFRPYTPVLEDLKGSDEKYLHFMIKIYSHGAFTRQLASVAVVIGDMVEVGDPEGTFDLGKLKKKKTIIMLAAGSGLTPMIKLYAHWKENYRSGKAMLFFFNKTTKDILWREKWEKFVSSEKDKFVFVPVLSEADSDWNGLKGRVSLQLLKSNLPSSSSSTDETLICVCGPTPFTHLSLELLKTLGYSESQVHAFEG